MSDWFQQQDRAQKQFEHEQQNAMRYAQDVARSRSGRGGTGPVESDWRDTLKVLGAMLAIGAVIGIPFLIIVNWPF